MPTPPKKPPNIRKPAPAPPSQSQVKASNKTFKVEAWTGEGEGEKVVGYADTGLGKTTLFSMMPNPVFIGLDDGGRRIRNPKTDKPISHIPGIETYEDVRAILQQADLFPTGSTCVVDTFTILEQFTERWVLENVKLPKGGQAKNIKAYGYNEGSSHVLDALRLILQDLDTLIRRGVNVGVLCQEQAVAIANAEGLDYLQACPKLHHDKQYSAMLELCAWADHVFRIDYLNSTVRADGERITGKVVSTDLTRAIYIQGAQYFRAKSRTLNRFLDDNGEMIRCIAFDRPNDNSIWRFIFEGEK